MQTVWASVPQQQAGILQALLCQTALLAEVTQLLCSRSPQGLKAQHHQLIMETLWLPTAKETQGLTPHIQHFLKPVAYLQLTGDRTTVRFCT